jgi:hypothetical protein
MPDLKAVPAPQEKILADALHGLFSASSAEVTSHFLVLMRLLTRALVGGSGSGDVSYSDPYSQSALRSEAFIVILQVPD